MKIHKLLEDDRGGFGFDQGDQGDQGSSRGSSYGGERGVGGSESQSQNSNLRLRDLSTLQIAMLKKISSGALDVDNISDRQMDVVDELNQLGLVDDSYELTTGGQRAVTLSAKTGIQAPIGGSSSDNFDKSDGDFGPDDSDDFDSDDFGSDDSAEFGDSDEFDELGSEDFGKQQFNSNRPSGNDFDDDDFGDDDDEFDFKR